MSLLSHVLHLLLLHVLMPVFSMHVAMLSNHNKDASKWDCGAPKVECNALIYQAAISEARTLGADLLLLPEAYGLQDIGSPEVFHSPVGSNPCKPVGEQTDQPKTMQAFIACAAASNSIAVTANFFVTVNSTKRIADVVFDKNGTVLAVYYKNHLFPTESLDGYSAGPFNPTVFQYGGKVFGLVICYEGLYPTLTGNWKQFESLQLQGADVLLWSIGGLLPENLVGPKIASKFKVNVLTSECEADAEGFDKTGGKVKVNKTEPIRVGNYSGKASVVLVDVA